MSGFHREIAFERWGKKCELCGYERSVAALTVEHRKYTQAQLGGPYRFGMYCQNHVEETRIVCQNCHFERMWANRTTNAPKQRHWVWPSPIEVDGKAQMGFLDKKLRDGYEVVVVGPDGVVWRYGNPYEMIAPEWAMWAARVGFQGEKPATAREI